MLLNNQGEWALYGTINAYIEEFGASNVKITLPRGWSYCLKRQDFPDVKLFVWDYKVVRVEAYTANFEMFV